MKWVIGDVHGTFLTMLALIKKIKEKDPNAELVFLGDYVDRGPRSAEVVKFILDGVKNGEFQAIHGNHESLMKSHFESPFRSIWTQNGGNATIQSYHNLYQNINYEEKMVQDAEKLMELPSYIIFDDEDSEHRHLVVSHAPVLDFIEDYHDIYGHEDWEERSEKYEDEFGLFERCNITKKGDLISWNRKLPVYENKKYFNITGHNITGHLLENQLGIDIYDEETEVMIDREIGFACIDTGSFIECGHEPPFGGKLTALSYPGLEIIQQENIEIG